jgi:hypothetical protein
MALLSDDAEFYARAAAAWLLSACLAAAILRGWIRGQAFRARTFHLALLFYSTWLARDALKLHLLHGILPKVRTSPSSVRRRRHAPFYSCARNLLGIC